MPPTLVAPMVAYLAHEDCPVTGEIYAAGAGRFARLFIATDAGLGRRGGEPTIEDVAEHWAAINDETGYTVPRRPAWTGRRSFWPTSPLTSPTVQPSYSSSRSGWFSMIQS